MCLVTVPPGWWGVASDVLGDCPWGHQGTKGAHTTIRPLLKVGPTLPPGGGGGWVFGLWVGGLLWFWAIWPKVPTPPQGGG